MTQKQTQSVRNAEAANKTVNQVPTFDEVYAMTYVRDSIQSIVDQNLRQYPALVGHKDDIIQDIWIQLHNSLSKYNSQKSSLCTFCRIVIHSAMNKTRRAYFTEDQQTIHYSQCIDFLDRDDDESSSHTNYSVNNVQYAMDTMDIETLIARLPEASKEIVEMLFDGLSMREIAARKNLPLSTLWHKYFIPLRKYFSENFFQ